MTNSGTPPLTPLTTRLLAVLDERSRDIIERRFGIITGEVETLDSIGKKYGITRERVRQIEAQAKKVLTAQNASLTPVATIFEQIFINHGGLLAEQHAVTVIREAFGEELSNSHVAFYLEILPAYQYVSRDPHFDPHWRHPSLNAEQAEATVENARAILKTAGHPLAETDFLNRISTSSKQSKPLPTPHVYAYLSASKHISKTPFGEWGLRLWSETNPRGVGDKAYAVLRRHGKPEHFTRITEMINEVGFDHKRANAQTVHNELIKDSRFVLVGRGLYGLTEWGYIPGTVADVLESLLSRANQPLTREELIEQVLAQRQVKKNTILLGLQNEKRFVKTDENHYTIRRA